MKLVKSLFSFALILSAMPSFANWQYNGYYVNDGGYSDDGSRFVVGLRGGASYGYAKMKNDVGSLDSGYWVNTSTGQVISDLRYELAGGEEALPDFVYAGQGNIGSLPIKKDFSKMVFTAGGSIGFTIPNSPQWRLEAGYDYIAETSYNRVPLFEGDLKLSGGDLGDCVARVSSTGASSTITTDVISAMAFYDFFDGNKKPLNQIIPYIGLGVGYASSQTTLKLSDIYGDLTTDSDLQNYGTIEGGVLQFDSPSDKSKYPTSNNIALLGALGMSYGITEYTFIDFGARVMYIPKIKWELSDADGSRHREWFSAENMIYTNITLGLRFEF